MAPETLDRLARCERRVRYVFHDKLLLRAALTHASGADARVLSNERMEFLGDAILGAVVCEILYRRYPQYLEGELTRIKSSVVSRHTCAKLSGQLGLEEFLIVGKGISANRSVPPSLMADVFESLVAGIYLDGGHAAVQCFIETYVAPEIDLLVGAASDANFKSLLQQLSQREYGTTPIYQLLDERGPDHSKHFKMSANVAGTPYQPAWGRNKKEAEQRAACNALCELNGQPAPWGCEDETV